MYLAFRREKVRSAESKLQFVQEKYARGEPVNQKQAQQFHNYENNLE